MGHHQHAPVAVATVALFVAVALGQGAAVAQATGGPPQAAALVASEKVIPRTVEECDQCEPMSVTLGAEWHPLRTNVARLSDGHELVVIDTVTGTGGLEIAQVRTQQDAAKHTKSAERRQVMGEARDARERICAESVVAGNLDGGAGEVYYLDRCAGLRTTVKVQGTLDSAGPGMTVRPVASRTVAVAQSVPDAQTYWELHAPDLDGDGDTDALAVATSLSDAGARLEVQVLAAADGLADPTPVLIVPDLAAALDVDRPPDFFMWVDSFYAQLDAVNHHLVIVGQARWGGTGDREHDWQIQRPDRGDFTLVSYPAIVVAVFTWDPTTLAFTKTAVRVIHDEVAPQTFQPTVVSEGVNQHTGDFIRSQLSKTTQPNGFYGHFVVADGDGDGIDELVGLGYFTAPWHDVRIDDGFERADRGGDERHHEFLMAAGATVVVDGARANVRTLPHPVPSAAERWDCHHAVAAELDGLPGDEVVCTSTSGPARWFSPWALATLNEDTPPHFYDKHQRRHGATEVFTGFNAAPRAFTPVQWFSPNSQDRMERRASAWDHNHDGVDELIVTLWNPASESAVKRNGAYLYGFNRSAIATEGDQQFVRLQWLREHQSAVLLPVDVDADATVVRFKGHDMYLSNPEILVVLAAPPYVRGIGQGPGESAFGFTSQTCNARTELTVFAQDFSLGFSTSKSAGLVVNERFFEIDVLARASLTQEHADRQDVCLETGMLRQPPGTDHAVMYRSTPVDVYTYEVLSGPHEEEVGSAQRQHVIGKPGLFVWTATEYNNAVARYNADLPTLSGEISDLELTQAIAVPTESLFSGLDIGDPGTYPDEAERDRRAGAAARLFNLDRLVTQDLEEWDDLESRELRNRILQRRTTAFTYASAPLPVDQARNTLSIGLTRSDGSAFEWTAAGGLEVSISAGYFKGGADLLWGDGASYEASLGSTQSFSATVPPITDRELLERYFYRWGLFVYPACFGPDCSDSKRIGWCSNEAYLEARPGYIQPPGAEDAQDEREPFNCNTMKAALPMVVDFYVDQPPRNKPPAAFDQAVRLNEPPMGAQVGRDVGLTWHPYAKAVAYDVHVWDADQSTLNPLDLTYRVEAQEHARPDGTAFLLPPAAELDLTELIANETLRPHHVYRWTVTTSNLINTTTPPAAPRTFVIVDPPAKVTGLRLDGLEKGPVMHLEWDPVRGEGRDRFGRAETYEVIAKAANAGVPSASDSGTPAANPRIEMPAPGGPARVFVRGVGGGGAGPWSEPLDVAMPRAPAAPAPQLTVFGDAQVKSPPVTWAAVTSADSYEVRVDLGEPATVTATTWVPPVDLSVGSHRLQVRAWNGVVPSAWSAPLLFLHNAAPEDAPVVTAASRTQRVAFGDVDTNSSIVYRSLPVSWRPVDGAYRYEVVLAQSWAFESTVHSAFTTDTAWTSEDLAGGEYWLRARALNGAAAGPWSDPVPVFVESKALETAAPGLGALAAVIAFALFVTARRRS